MRHTKVFYTVARAHLGCISLFLLSGLRYARSDAHATSGAAPENEMAGVELYENANKLHIETKGRQGDVLLDGQSLAALFAAVQTVSGCGVAVRPVKPPSASSTAAAVPECGFCARCTGPMPCPFHAPTRRVVTRPARRSKLRAC